MSLFKNHSVISRLAAETNIQKQNKSIKCVFVLSSTFRLRVEMIAQQITAHAYLASNNIRK